MPHNVLDLRKQRETYWHKCLAVDIDIQNDRPVTDLHKVFACAEHRKRPYRDRRTGR